MLPILRMTPVGGVLIAIVALVLGFTVPGLSRTRAARVEPPARGALIEQAQHPEWRQFLILAAFQRADELNRLRDLPDNPVRAVPLPTSKPATSMPKAPLPATEILPAVMVPPPAKDTAKDTAAAPVLAGLPADRQDADPDDATGTISAAPEAAIPVDIGEASSTELPVSKSEEKPPVIRTPERTRPPSETRRKTMRHARRAKPPAKPDTQQIDFFGALFNNQQNATNKQAGK